MIDKRYKGIFYIVLSAFSFALMNVFVRMSGELPSIQKSFFRNLIAFFIAAALLKRSGTRFSGDKRNLGFLLLRSGFGTMGILCNYYAIDHLLLADASMLNKMSPFFAILFSIWILKEKVKLRQLLYVAGAFAGALFILKPTVVGMDLRASLIGLLGGVGAGAAYTFVRLLSERGEKGPFIVAFFSGFSCLVTLPYLLFHFSPMSLAQLLSLLLAGLAAAGGQFAITAAYSWAPAREISVYDYSQILFAAVLGFVIFGQTPDLFSWLGYTIICAMAIQMFLYNQKAESGADE